VVLSRVVGVFVDADHERGVDVGRRGRDDDLFRSRAEVLASALARGESSGRLDDDVDVQFAQGSSAGLRSASTLMVLDRRSCVVGDRHGYIQAPLCRVVPQEVGVDFGDVRSFTARVDVGVRQ